MKKILRDQSGMALPTVLGIMLVVAILATGMFYFSYNELNFSTINKQQGQAQYLAKAGVEIAAKAFPGVSGQFFGADPSVTPEPVTATLYLHYDPDSDAEPVLNSEEEGNRGKVNVTITQDTRDIKSGIEGSTTETSTVNVWVYEAQAEVDNSKSTAKGFTLPTALANSKLAEGSGSESESEEDENRQSLHLNWISGNGEIEKDIQNESGGLVYTEGSPTDPGGLTGFINDIFGGRLGEISTSYAAYNGVVTIDKDVFESNTKKISFNADERRIFVWAAPATVIETPVDLRGAKDVNGLAIVSNTIIFEDEVRIYANSTETRVGDLILQPMNGEAQVYFNDNVYLYLGSSRYKLFEAGSVYTFDESVDLLTWAVNQGGVSAGLSNWLRQIFKEQSTGDLEEVPNPAVVQPNTNSLTKIIWE